LKTGLKAEVLWLRIKVPSLRMTNLQWMGAEVRRAAHPAGSERDIYTKKI
jgi:hypothetical protein